ncbi:hypothetical protein [Streptomyces sp. NPDC002516]
MNFGELAVAVFGAGFGEPGTAPGVVAVDEDLLPDRWGAAFAVEQEFSSSAERLRSASRTARGLRMALVGVEYRSGVSMPPASQSPYQTSSHPGDVTPPAPPQKSRVGLIARIIGGVLVLVVALLTTLALGGRKLENSYPKAEHILTVPRALVDGRYTLTRDDSTTKGQTLARSWRNSWDAEAVHGIAALYHADKNHGDQGDLAVTAMYGRFRNTAEVRAQVLADNSASTTRVKVLVPPKEVTPSGSRIRVDCEMVQRTWANHATLAYPVCAWADGNTWARVADMTYATIMNADLKAAARTTLRIRSEMMKPIR